MIRVGSNNAGSLTINGAITGTGQDTGNEIIRVYDNSSVTINGSVAAPDSFININATPATITNNGSVDIQNIATTQGASAIWTQGTNANLTIANQSGWNGTLNASAAGNTITYNGGTPITPSSNTYYNLMGSAVTCPSPFTIL